MSDPKSQLANLLAKASAKPKEPEMVTVGQFIGQDGKVYWAKKARTPSCIARALVTKQVVKGSPEDQ
jgi:hypothetical protein